MAVASGQAQERAPDLPGARLVHEEEDARAERARREVLQLEAELARTRVASVLLVEKVARLDQRLSLQRARMTEATARERVAAIDAQDARAKAESLVARLAGTRRRMGLVLTAIAREGESPAPLRLLAALVGDPVSTSEASAAVEWLTRESDEARDLAMATESARSAVAEAERREEELAQASERAALALLSLEAEREVRRSELAALRSEPAARERWQSETAAAAEGFAARPSGLRPFDSSRMPGLAASRGRLPWPLDRAGARDLLEPFGRRAGPRRGTSTLNHGIVLRAEAGQPVRAVAPGFVAHADWYKGFGRCVIVDHGKGFLSVIAHCQDLSVEQAQEVAGGEVLATVGDTGSLDGPRLYFQISHDGVAVDPLQWLAR